MRPVKKIEIDGLTERTSLTTQLTGKTLRIILSNGRALEIELFERKPGRIEIRAGSFSRSQVVVRPGGGINVVSVTCE